MVQMWNTPTGSWVWTLGLRWWCLFWKVVEPSGGGPLQQGHQRVGLITDTLSWFRQSSLLPYCLPDVTPSFLYQDAQYPQTLSQNISCLPGFCQVQWQDPGSPHPVPSSYPDFLLWMASDCRRMVPFPSNISCWLNVILGLSVTNNSQGQKEQWYCRACRLWRESPCFIHKMNRRIQGMCQHAIWKEECVRGNMPHM